MLLSQPNAHYCIPCLTWNTDVFHSFDQLLARFICANREEKGSPVNYMFQIVVSLGDHRFGQKMWMRLGNLGDTSASGFADLRFSCTACISDEIPMMRFSSSATTANHMYAPTAEVSTNSATSWKSVLSAAVLLIRRCLQRKVAWKTMQLCYKELFMSFIYEKRKLYSMETKHFQW